MVERPAPRLVLCIELLCRPRKASRGTRDSYASLAYFWVGGLASTFLTWGLFQARARVYPKRERSTMATGRCVFAVGSECHARHTAAPCRPAYFVYPCSNTRLPRQGRVSHAATRASVDLVYPCSNMSLCIPCYTMQKHKPLYTLFTHAGTRASVYHVYPCSNTRLPSAKPCQVCVLHRARLLLVALLRLDCGTVSGSEVYKERGRCARSTRVAGSTIKRRYRHPAQFPFLTLSSTTHLSIGRNPLHDAESSQQGREMRVCR